MSLFRQQRPRGFRHNCMYVDVRREQFREMEQRVRKRQHGTAAEKDKNDVLRGTFSGSVSHLRRRNGHGSFGGITLSSGMMIVLVLILIVIWKILLTV